MVISLIITGLISIAIGIALNELTAADPDIENARPAGDGEFKFPTASEDRVVPILFGTELLKGPNVVWWGDRSQTAIKETIKISLLRQKRVITGWRYSVGIQFGLCRGQIEAITGVWIGDTRVFTGSVQDGPITINEPNLFGGDENGTGGVVGTLRVQSGTETQAVNAYLTPFQDPQPAYRGSCYAVWEGGLIGNSATNIKPWSFEVSRFPNQLGLSGGKEKVNTTDANPAAVIYEFLTNDDWGFGFPAVDVDSANLITAGNTLFDEGNGFSFRIEKRMDAQAFLMELERQIGGVVYLDQLSGKWRITLARGGYSIASLKKVDSTNTIKVMNFGRGSWDETINQIRIGYSDRIRDYFKTFAIANDNANLRLQGNEQVSSTREYPGIKNSPLAEKIATRDLKEVTIPLARAKVAVDRSLWDVILAEVVAWSDLTLGIVDLPMRVVRINRGTLTNSEIILTMVQDVFEFEAAIFGSQPHLWVPPTEDVTAIAADEQRVVEAPFGVIRRDPNFPGVEDRLMTMGRSPGGPELRYKVFQRNDPVTPSGSFTFAGDVFDFVKVGELGTLLDPSDANPTVTIRLDSNPDTIADLLLDFSVASAGDVGNNLVNLILIDDEFMGVETVIDQTTFIDLKNVHRGLMDTVPAVHAVNAPVILVFVGVGLSDSVIPPTNVVDVQLRTASRDDETTEGEANTVQLTMQDRARSPYPPVEPIINGVRYDPTVDIDDLKSGGSTLDERGIETTFTRRNFETLDEVAGIATDAGTLDPTFPTKHNTRYSLSIFERSPSLSTSLEVFYNLDEAAGANAIDAGPNGHDATDVNGVQTAAGHGAGVGTARDFVKTDLDHFTLADNADISFADEDMEIFCFFRPGTISAGQTHGLVSKFKSSATVEVEYGLFQSVDGLFFAVSSDGGIGGGFTQVASSLTLVAGTYYGVWARHDATANTIEIEVVDVANPLRSSTIDTLAHTGGIHDGARPLELGLIRSSTADQYLLGRLSVVGIWRKLLTQTEKEVIYNFNGGGNQVPFTGALLAPATAFASAATAFVSRTPILRSTDGRLPADLRLEILARQDIVGGTFDALQELDFNFTRVAGGLDNDTNFGVQATNVVGTIASAPDTGTYTFNVGTALPNGVVEAQINGGGFATVIAATATTGTLAGVTAGDTIEVRHTESVATVETFLEVVPPTSTVGAYGILVN